MRNVSDKKVIEKIKTDTLCSVTFFSFENLAVYGIRWKNIVEPGRSQMNTWSCSLHAGHLRLQTHTENM